VTLVNSDSPKSAETRWEMAMKKPAPKQLDLFADIPRLEPTAPTVDEALRLKMLADSRREVRNLTVMGVRPDISADQREIIRQLERSARAQMKLGLQSLSRGKPKAPARREVRNLVVLGLRPDLPADRRELIHNAERSARAEVKLRIKALPYCREQQRGRRRASGRPWGMAESVGRTQSFIANQRSRAVTINRSVTACLKTVRRCCSHARPPPANLREIEPKSASGGRPCREHGPDRLALTPPRNRGHKS
jgi:hypothetical protein